MRNLRLFILVAFLATLTLAQECIPDDERIDCHPDNGTSEERCVERGCTWCVASVPGRNTPDCFFPREYGYRMVGEPVDTGHGYRVELNRTISNTLFGNEADQLTLEIDFQSDYRLRIKISDDKPRWEVPMAIDQPATNWTENALFDVRFTNVPAFSFLVLRKETGTIVFDSALGGFVFSDQFIQLGVKLPSRNVYGIGENEQKSLRHSFEGRPNFPLWGSGFFPDYNRNLYGVHPQYYQLNLCQGQQ